MHNDDIAALGFDDGDIVDLHTHWDGDEIDRTVRAFRIVRYETPRGTAAAYYPETNPLIPIDSTADHQQHTDIQVRDRETLPDGEGLFG